MSVCRGEEERAEPAGAMVVAMARYEAAAAIVAALGGKIGGFRIPGASSAVARCDRGDVNGGEDG
jgi:hypothetical protein